MKKKVLLTSIMTIVLCLCLIAGSTFALFTSQSEVGIEVTAAKVEMTANISALKLASVRPATVAEIRNNPEIIIEDEFGGQYVYADRADTFANGGTAIFEDATLTLDRITPGDKVSFNIEGANTSDVTVQYRYVIECEDGQKLMSALRISVEGVTYEFLGAYTSGWKTLTPGNDITPAPVVIEFPVDKGNEYQELTTKIKVTVEAVQGNADVSGSQYDVVEFLDGVNVDMEGKTISGVGVVNYETLDLSNGTIAIKEVGFENFGNATLTNVAIDGGTPGTVAYGYAIVSNNNSNTDLNNVDIATANGGIAAANGAKVVFNGGEVIINSANTAQRYNFYAQGAGTVIEVNDGTFAFEAYRQRSYVAAIEGAKVYIKGGTFGVAPNHSRWKNPIYTDAASEVIITGGTFGFDPTKWVAEGCKAVKEGSVWTVKPVAVTTAEELAELLTSDAKNIAVTLANDIDLPISALGNITAGSGEYKLGGANTDNIIIDLNGNKLNITTTYWSAIGANNDNATITIKNGSMTSTGNSAGTWNAYDVRLCNCNYVIENVTFDKAVAIDNAGKSTTMKNVTINATGDVYALWITAEGQNVTIDGLTINSEGRGIKIDEQYVAAPEKVILNVSNATFNTVKKAAVIVKSAAGADITLDNVNIDNVKGDFTNAVWNDADSAASFDKITVVGGTIAQEN
jgi:hypothetical protein